MTTKPSMKKGNRRGGESGQTMVFVLLAMSFFLLGLIGFGLDMGYLWFHRQTSQTAADAACTAGVMDMLSGATGGTPASGFTAGTAFDCSASPTASPCVYAAKNDISAGGLVTGQPSSEVHVSFPGSVTGLPACATGTNAPAICNASSFVTNPFMQVNVTDRVQSFFSGMITGKSTTDVGAQSTCAVVFSNAPIPLLVLDPRNESSVNNNGNFQITIEGGPQRSIQVNASSSSAVSISGASGNFDLSHGGPNFTGSDFAVTGTEGATNFTTGATGHWLSPTGAISDPFAQIPAPTKPGLPVVPTDVSGIANCSTGTHIANGDCQVNNGVHGCPDTTCILYTGGAYDGGIHVKQKTAIFDPGVYYLSDQLFLDTLSCVRPATGVNAVGDGSGGTMFYFAAAPSVQYKSNSGSSCPAAKVPPDTVRCITSGPGTTVLPADVITNGGLEGNVLLGPCNAPSGGGTNYGDPLGVDDPMGEQRGMLFFQNRSMTNTTPQWGGGSSFGLAGIMYFHNCSSPDGAGLGSNCPGTTAYTDQLSLQGGSCSHTFVIGDVVVDQLHLGGNPCIEMDLNPSALFYVLKASLIQ
jgi:Putative Flp pilus-assembly TadE/G-like